MVEFKDDTKLWEAHADNSETPKEAGGIGQKEPY